MTHTFDTVIVGAGIFGTTAAVELARRGQRIALLDPGPIPHPLAASTDISKVVRLEYGADLEYMVLMESARTEWLRWNEELGAELYHETGVVLVTRATMAPGEYEYESFELLIERGHRPERLDVDEIARRFPAWRPGAYSDGFYHAMGGYAESGRVVASLVDRARQLGVALYPGQTVDRVLGDETRVTGAATREGESFAAGQVLIAAGAWTPILVPELTSVMRVTGHPVFHLQPTASELFHPPHFAVFTADITRSGWYGFPMHPVGRTSRHAMRRGVDAERSYQAAGYSIDGVVKVANHGIGQELHPMRDERVVTEHDVAKLRTFLRDALPSLADAPVTYTRRCLYCDTLDGDFLIDRHPDREGLFVASGGSGHGFKFAPILGQLAADVVLDQPNPHLAKFRWRDIPPDKTGKEGARYQG